MDMFDLFPIFFIGICLLILVVGVLIAIGLKTGKLKPAEPGDSDIDDLGADM